MLLRVEEVGTTVVLTIMDNKLDASSHDEFNREVTPILARSTQIVLDFDKVEFVDSSGCNLLIRLVTKLRLQNGQLKIGGLRPRIRDTFHLVGLQRTCDLYDTVEEAVKAFEESAREQRT
jgi:anti-sigma B factor antagonist